MKQPPSPRAPLQPQRIAPTLFAHLVLQTSRYEELKHWYMQVLTAHVVHEGHGLCFLTYDDEHHRIAIKQVPDMPPRDPQAAGIHHVAYTHAQLGDLLGTYLRLKQQGILPWWSINHGPTTSLYYQDPDGNRVELQVENLSKQAATAFFQSEDFRDNPVGIRFDPDALVRDYEAGVPLAQLLRRPRLPPGMTPADMRPAP